MGLLLDGGVRPCKCNLLSSAPRSPVGTSAHVACDYLFLLTIVTLSVCALGRDVPGLDLQGRSSIYLDLIS